MRRILLFLLISCSVFGQVTQINGLQLTGVWPNSQGGIHLEWTADPGEDNTTHGANDQWFVQWSQRTDFIDAPNKPMTAWLNANTLRLEYDIPPIGNGIWNVRIAFGWSIEQIFDVTAHGSVSGWTPYASVVVNNSYDIPKLILPDKDIPYTGTELLLHWVDSENIPSYQLQISDSGSFFLNDTLNIGLLITQNHKVYADLSQFDAGILQFRFRGTTKTGVTTDWTFGLMNFQPSRVFTYGLPYISETDQTKTFVGISILNDAIFTDLRIGIMPKKTGSFEPTVWWQELTAYQGTIFLENVGEMYPFDTKGLVLTLESTEPIEWTTYIDTFLFGDSAIHVPFIISEGFSNEWVVPFIRFDQDHRPAVVVSNHSEFEDAVFKWRLDYTVGGVDYYIEDTGWIEPYRNTVIDISALDVHPEWNGTFKVTNQSNADIAVLYSIRNEPETGKALYGFSSGQQKEANNGQ